MDSILYKIIEIEKKARQINDEVLQAKLNRPSELDAERKRLSEIANRRMEKELAAIAKEHEEDESKKNDRAERVQKEQLVKLRAVFGENHVKWENEIYEAIRKK